MKPTNIVVSIDRDPEIIRDFLRDYPSETFPPRLEPELSSEPIMTVKSQPLPNFGLDRSLSNLTVKLTDFGSGKCSNCLLSIASSFQLSARYIDKNDDTALVYPVKLRAPEVTLSHPWSTPVDIWALGCLVSRNLYPNSVSLIDPLLPSQTFEFITGSTFIRLESSLGNGTGKDAAEADIKILSQLVAYLGQFPESFLKKSKRSKEFFDDKGQCERG